MQACYVKDRMLGLALVVAVYPAALALVGPY